MKFGLPIRFVLLCGWLAFPSASNAQFSNCDPDGVQASGAIYRICMPADRPWNGDLIVFAREYVKASNPPGIPEEQFVLGGVSVAQVANLLGFAFATSGYSTNGLAVKEGLEDLVDLVDVFVAGRGQPNHVYLIGPGEGGLVTALALEQHPEVFDGGISACGPIGDFPMEINYIGDFRVLFDHYFPGVIPGDPTWIPQVVMDNWNAVYKPRVRRAIWSDLVTTIELFRVAQARVDLFDPENLLASIQNTVEVLLWYNIFGTNDAAQKLGGQPYDNTTRWYTGSGNDPLLNALIPRYAADPAALDEIEAHYQTSADLTVPMVTVHTVADEMILYEHQPLYALKAESRGTRSMVTQIPVIRYGNCNLTIAEVLISFAILVNQVTGEPLDDVEVVLAKLASHAP